MFFLHVHFSNLEFKVRFLHGRLGFGNVPHPVICSSCVSNGREAGGRVLCWEMLNGWLPGKLHTHKHAHMHIIETVLIQIILKYLYKIIYNLYRMFYKIKYTVPFIVNFMYCN